MMNTISKSKLKAHMLRVFREIEASGETLVVTDRSVPVLKITPIEKKGTVQDIFGDVQGQVVFHEDIDTPTLEEWGDLA
jgi:antitoxin (DNA-binding transcriptional repressor) of toxin-antitoxin stability system